MKNLILYSLPLIMLDVFFWRSVFPKKTLIRLLLRTGIFCLFSWLIFLWGVSPFSPPVLSDSFYADVFKRFLAAFWWFSAAALLSLLVYFLFEFNKNQNNRNRFFRDLINAILFIIALAASLTNVFDFSLRGLVATSGVLAVILGLAIQSSLNDVFSGLVLNATAPCAIGDWIKIDTTEGKVIDINWRATHLITMQGNIVIIPNSVIAKAKIINNNRPAKLHGISILIEVSVSERPEAVLTALNNALIGMSILLEDPKPFTLVKTVSMNTVQYEVAAFVDEVGKKRFAINTLYDLCHRHLAAAGVELKPLGVNINHHADVFDPKKKLLSFVRLFQLLTHEEVTFLSNNMSVHFYEPDDVIISPDTVADYLLIIASGVVAVESITNNNQAAMVRLSPGDSIGGASIIAGIPSRLTVKALIPTVVYRLDKQMISSLLTEYEDAGKKLCQMLSQSETLSNVLETTAADLAESKQSIFERLVDAMHKFHRL